MNFKRIYLEITNICNLNCSFCSPLKREKRSMSIEEIERILNMVKVTNAHIYPHIKGEPLSHKEFDKFLILLSKYNLPLNLTTNGVLISRYSDLLLEYARQVNISVHSLLDGQIKNPAKYMEDIISFGLMARENKKPNVSYRFWTEKEGNFSKDSLDIISKLSEKFGVFAREEIKKGRNAVKLCDNVYISLMNKFEWPDLNKENKRSFGNCLGGKDMIGILADGTVVPCCLDADGIINLGNVFEKSLEEILNGERFLKLKDGFSGSLISEQLCQKCTFYDSRKQNK